MEVDIGCGWTKKRLSCAPGRFEPFTNIEKATIQPSGEAQMLLKNRMH